MKKIARLIVFAFLPAVVILMCLVFIGSSVLIGIWDLICKAWDASGDIVEGL